MACPKQRPAPRTRTGKKVPAKSLRLPKNKTFLESVPGLPRHMAWFLPSFTQAHTKKRGRKRQIGCSRASPAACWAEPCFCTGRRRAAASTRSWPRLIRPAKDHHVQQELPEALQSPISAPAASPSLVTSTVLRAQPHLSPQPPSCPTDPGHGDKWTSGRGHPDPSPNVNPPRLGYPRCRIGRNKRSASREGLEDLISWLLALGNYCCTARPNYAAINFSSREIR